MVAQSHAVADDLGTDPLVRREPYMMQDPGMRQISVRRGDPQIRRAPNSAGLYDVLDLILDKGMVIDAFVRVSLVGIELLTIDLRIVIASVDTYLRYAEGVDRLQIRGDEKSEPKNLPGMVSGGMKGNALKKGAESIGHKMFGHEEEDREDNSQHGVVGALAKGVRRAVGRVAGALSGDPSEYEDEAHGGGGGEREDENEDEGRKDRGREKERPRNEGGQGQHRGREGERRMSRPQPPARR